MAQKKKTNPHMSQERLTDEELENVVGGAGTILGDGQGGYTPGDYDVMEAQGPADRSQHGPGSGE